MHHHLIFISFLYLVRSLRWLKSITSLYISSYSASLCWSIRNVIRSPCTHCSNQYLFHFFFKPSFLIFHCIWPYIKAISFANLTFEISHELSFAQSEVNGYRFFWRFGEANENQWLLCEVTRGITVAIIALMSYSIYLEKYSHLLSGYLKEMSPRSHFLIRHDKIWSEVAAM